MECSEFLARFSDYQDGSLVPAERTRFDGHLEACSSCRRYRDVVRRGVDLLRSIPPLEPPSDFRPRLRHRIYHLEDSDVLHGGSDSGSATTAATALVMAVLLTAAAWSPTMRKDVTVDLPPILVTTPRPQVSSGPATFTEALPGPAYLTPGTTPDLWHHSHSVLYEYSSLSSRHRSARVLRNTALGFD